MNKPNNTQGRGRAPQARTAAGSSNERPQQRSDGRNVTPPASEAEYFNLHASGCGYLSRVRWVDPKRSRGGRSGDKFLACAINALRGEVSAPNYTYFDLRVSGEEASQIVEDLKQAVDENRKVFVAFKLGDFYVETYDRHVLDEQRRKTDKMETKALIKGRLLLVTHAKIDGEVVYDREDGNDGTGGGSQEPGQEAQSPEALGDEPGQAGELNEADGQAGEGEPPQASAQRARPANASRRPAANVAPMDRSQVRSYRTTGTHG